MRATAATVVVEAPEAWCGRCVIAGWLLPRRARALPVAALLLVALAVAEPTNRVRPRALTQADVGTRLRVFAAPGDFALSNARVTAVVRRSDGWLTDLWSNRGNLPSIAQLGTTTDVDALWQLHPVVRVGKQTEPVIASLVQMRDDAVEIHGSAEVAGATVRVVTRVAVDADRPRVVLESAFTLEAGTATRMDLGDAFKWGNVQYFVEGIAKPRLSYRGPARWIGRRGAGGDLLMRNLGGAKSFIDYRARIRGFQGTIHAFHHRGALEPGRPVTLVRELSFEPLPIAKPTKVPEVGTLRVAVSSEARTPLPAKLTIDRLGRRQPLFDDDGGLDGTDRFLWTGNGVVEKELEPGRYTMLVTSGYERDATRHVVDVRAGKTTEVESVLPRVVATPGWIAGDLHLHQVPSVDADIGLPQRIVSIAAEGVEFAVATDHYVTTDLEPDVRWMRERGVLASPLQTVVGCEVSTLGHRYGHFNVFPLAMGANVSHTDTTVDELFADARRKAPGGVLQVNHPRWDPAIGYFSYFGIDDASGSMSRPGFNPNFDTVEVYNGDDARDLKLVRRVLLDWVHLLGRGARYAATGSSDSHKLAFLDPGLPRTMIRHGASADDASDVAAPQGNVIAAIKAGRSFVTSGPMLDVSVAGKGPGEVVKGVGAGATIDVLVRAAPWVDVATVEVLVGGRGDVAHFVPVPRTRSVERLRRSFRIATSAPTFVIVVVTGERGLPNASREHTVPFAFTNPIWLEP